MKRKRMFALAVVAGLLLVAIIGPAIPHRWPSSGFVQARAYLYNLDSNGSAGLLKDGKLHASVVNPTGTLLSSNQTQRVIRAMIDPEHPAARDSKCEMIPRHGVIFYDVHGQPVSYVELCFDCELYQLSARRPKLHPDWAELRAVFTEAGLPIVKGEAEYKALKLKLAESKEPKP